MLRDEGWGGVSSLFLHFLPTSCHTFLWDWAGEARIFSLTCPTGAASLLRVHTLWEPLGVRGWPHCGSPMGEALSRQHLTTPLATFCNNPLCSLVLSPLTWQVTPSGRVPNPCFEPNLPQSVYPKRKPCFFFTPKLVFFCSLFFLIF